MDNPQLVGGVYLPDGETHLVEHMQANRVEVGGRLTYQVKKLRAALAYVGSFRRGLAVDIGAHVGLWSMWLAGEFTRVEAFEPVPMLADIFRMNIDAANCRLNQFALGESVGIVDMQVPVETTGNSHVAIAGRHPGTRGVAHPERMTVFKDIPLRTLDSFGFAGVGFIKIDVEGYERAVIAGAEQTIKASRPVIICEQKGNDSAYGDDRMAAVKLLESWGMRTKEVMSGDYIMGW